MISNQRTIRLFRVQERPSCPGTLLPKKNNDICVVGLYVHDPR
jgi:hypothetical protein